MPILDLLGCRPASRSALGHDPKRLCIVLGWVFPTSSYCAIVIVFLPIAFALRRRSSKSSSSDTPRRLASNSNFMLPYQSSPWRLRIAPHIAGPAVGVVVGHALVDQRLHRRHVPPALCAGQRLGADVLPPAGVVALIQFVPAADLGADRVPQQLHDLDPLDILDAVRGAGL